GSEPPESQLVEEGGDLRMRGELVVEPAVPLAEVVQLGTHRVAVALDRRRPHPLDRAPRLFVETAAHLLVERVERRVHPLDVVVGRLLDHRDRAYQRRLGSSASDASVASGRTRERAASSARCFPVRTSTPRIPTAWPPPTSDSRSSPITAAS